MRWLVLVVLAGCAAPDPYVPAPIDERPPNGFLETPWLDLQNGTGTHATMSWSTPCGGAGVVQVPLPAPDGAMVASWLGLNLETAVVTQGDVTVWRDGEAVAFAGARYGWRLPQDWPYTVDAVVEHARDFLHAIGATGPYQIKLGVDYADSRTKVVIQPVPATLQPLAIWSYPNGTQIFSAEYRAAAPAFGAEPFDAATLASYADCIGGREPDLRGLDAVDGRLVYVHESGYGSGCSGGSFRIWTDALTGLQVGHQADDVVC